MTNDEEHFAREPISVFFGTVLASRMEIEQPNAFCTRMEAEVQQQRGIPSGDPDVYGSSTYIDGKSVIQVRIHIKEVLSSSSSFEPKLPALF